MAITNESPPAAVTVPAAPVLPRTSSSATPPPPPLSVGIGRVYERFLEMPVGFVLGVL